MLAAKLGRNVDVNSIVGSRSIDFWRIYRELQEMLDTYSICYPVAIVMGALTKGISIEVDLL